MDQASAAIERLRGGDCRLGHREDVGIFHRRARWRTNVMPVAIILMVRDVLVRIRWHLIDVAIGMDCELDARDASPRLIGGMRHAGEAGEDQHQACQERSEEHTLELQSLMRTSYAVFCWKKKIRAKFEHHLNNPH